MRIGLIDVDGHNFPNLALMKISTYHKSLGDHVEWWMGLQRYDVVYKSKVFAESPDETHCIQGDEVICGGTGYGLDNKLPIEIERCMPDYSLYPQYKEAYGYLTRGCPRGCPFCIVTQKEGQKSVQVANLDNFWTGQKEIKLLDSNILACADHEVLLQQLIDSGARVDFTQGVDARLLTDDNIQLINRIKTKNLHFAWDNAEDIKTYVALARFSKQTKLDYRRRTVYILTNFDTSHDQDLERVYKVWELGYMPYVMIYDKPNAPKKTRHLQRWANNPRIFKTQPDFALYNPKIG